MPILANKTDYLVGVSNTKALRLGEIAADSGSKRSNIGRCLPT